LQGKRGRRLCFAVRARLPPSKCTLRSYGLERAGISEFTRSSRSPAPSAEARSTVPATATPRCRTQPALQQDSAVAMIRSPVRDFDNFEEKVHAICEKMENTESISSAKVSLNAPALRDGDRASPPPLLLLWGGWAPPPCRSTAMLRRRGREQAGECPCFRNNPGLGRRGTNHPLAGHPVSAARVRVGRLGAVNSTPAVP
jgi:hypothetical protein